MFCSPVPKVQTGIWIILLSCQIVLSNSKTMKAHFKLFGFDLHASSQQGGIMLVPFYVKQMHLPNYDHFGR